MAVQRVAHLEAQRVARAKTARHDAVLATREDPVPQVAGAIGRTHDLDADLTGVPGAHDEARHAGHGARNGGERLHRFGTRRLLLPDVGEQRKRDGTLQSDHRGLGALVGDDGAALLERFEVGKVGLDIAGIDNQEPHLVRQLVDDQVVNHATLLVEQEGVLRLPLFEPIDVAGERFAQEVLCAGPRHLELAHVGYVEDAGTGAYGAMLFVDADVVHGHLPAAELDHASAELLVAVVQRCAAKAARHGSAKWVTERGVPIACELHCRHDTAFWRHMRDMCRNVTVALRLADATPVSSASV